MQIEVSGAATPAQAAQPMKLIVEIKGKRVPTEAETTDFNWGSVFFGTTRQRAEHMICSHPIPTIFLRHEPVDFRKGMDGLIGMCANELSRNPRSGAAFVFCNKSQKGIKVPYYDRQAGRQAGRVTGSVKRGFRKGKRKTGQLKSLTLGCKNLAHKNSSF